MDSLNDSKTILTTLRLDNVNGDVIGFAKGGPLENYNLRSEIKDALKLLKLQEINLKNRSITCGWAGYFQ